MKIRVTMKDPDTLTDAVLNAFERLPAPEGIELEEWHGLRDGRSEKVQGEITTQWMPYGEYLTVEFDTDAHTAVVVTAKDSAL